VNKNLGDDMGKFMKENLPEPCAFYEGEGLSLKGRGLWRMTSCPFHGGSDSFSINAQSGGFKCWACGAHGGDVLSFLMQRYGVGFVEGARKLGAWHEDGTAYRGRRKPLPMSPRELLDIAINEAHVVWVVACDMASRQHIGSPDHERLAIAVSRLERLCAVDPY